MEILANADEWTTTDEERLAEFLETPTGKRLIPALLKDSPELLKGGEINAILIRSGEVRAYQAMVESLLLMAHPPRHVSHTEPTNYPALENDAAWNDGQKITPENKTTETPQ
jgi:hypothetical protein